MTQLLFILRLVFLLLLYGFLGILAWLVWYELKQGSTAGFSVSQPAPRGERLIVIDPGDSGYAEGQFFALQTVTTIGRELSNNITIVDGYTSSQHASIERREDGRFWLTDLRSRNGTLFNGQQIQANDPVLLEVGDLIRIGKVEFKVG